MHLYVFVAKCIAFQGYLSKLAFQQMECHVDGLEKNECMEKWGG